MHWLDTNRMKKLCFWWIERNKWKCNNCGEFSLLRYLILSLHELRLYHETMKLRCTACVFRYFTSKFDFNWTIVDPQVLLRTNTLMQLIGDITWCSSKLSLAPISFLWRRTNTLNCGISMVNKIMSAFIYDMDPPLMIHFGTYWL